MTYLQLYTKLRLLIAEGEYMKYVVILGDGMADYPIDDLSGKTPLDVANKPNIDKLCSMGEIGLVKTVPQGFKPGSDVANLSVMGYAPEKYYSGRSPLEALSIGIRLENDDIAIRCNLVTLSDDKDYENKTMLDYSAGEISTQEASELIKYVNQNLGTDNLIFYAGVSYRHCLIKHSSVLGTNFTPPHDISDKKITEYLPSGIYSEIFLDLQKKSYELLKNHPINKERLAQGKNPANSIWLWGAGTKPMLDDFYQKWGLKGAVVSAVDLIKGIGIGANMKSIDVEGATGTYHTNFIGKAQATIDALKNGYDYVYLHMEAPDECGHQGDLKNKIYSIELIDKIVVEYIVKALESMNQPYSILVAPDHPTPISIKTHTSDPVPFVIFKSNDIKQNKYDKFNESNAKQSGLYFDNGESLIKQFIGNKK